MKNGKTKLPYHSRMAIRHFLASKGNAIPRGFDILYGLSGEKESYGKYAHVKLTEDQITTIARAKFCYFLFFAKIRGSRKRD